MRRFKAPSPAMVVALLALFVALGGTGYAAGKSMFSTPSKAAIVKIVKSVAPTLSVKSAAGATQLPSGQTESGLLAGGGSYNSGGWIALSVTYPRPLGAAIANDHIIEVRSPATSAAHCSGAGHAAPGYLCVYNYDTAGVAGFEAYSNDGADFPPRMGKFGANLYWTTSAPNAYVGGSWAVTAP